MEQPTIAAPAPAPLPNAHASSQVEDKVLDASSQSGSGGDKVFNQSKQLLSHAFSSVAGVGSYSAQGPRDSLEDREAVVDHFAGDPDKGFFAVYDGHGGTDAANFVSQHLHSNLSAWLAQHPDVSSLSSGLEHAYLMTEEQMDQAGIFRSGTTAITCVVGNENDKRMLFVAHVGDSRAVLCRGGRALRLTVDHHIDLPGEVDRIRQAGGWISESTGRVNSRLAMTRALGDKDIKAADKKEHSKPEEASVSPVPFFTSVTLGPSDDYLLLACDGLWDVMTEQQAVDSLQRHLSRLNASSGDAATSAPLQVNALLREVAKSMVAEALQLKSRDNVTVLIAKLN